METRKEKSFKQLQLNRDNIARYYTILMVAHKPVLLAPGFPSLFNSTTVFANSLKHTVTVLDEHLEALRKKHEIMVQKTRDTRYALKCMYTQ